MTFIFFRMMSQVEEHDRFYKAFHNLIIDLKKILRKWKHYIPNIWKGVIFSLFLMNT